MTITKIVAAALLAPALGCGGSAGGAEDTSVDDVVADAADGDGPDSGWTPPIGIPHPGFCIGQSVEDDCPACTVITDPDLASIDDIAPGTVVVITGGPFTGGQITIGGSGTAELPIFIRGPSTSDRPVVSRETVIAGSWIIVENIDFDFGRADSGVRITGDHICLRHSDVHDIDPGHNSTTVFIEGSTDVVLWDNLIHDNGDFDFVGEQDVHGIGATETHRIWILENTLHHNRGDSVQFGHMAANTLGDFYIGRNDIHSDGENCVDIKEASNVVVSENALHEPAATFPAIVFHDCPLNAAAIYNEIHSADAGVSMASLETACDPHLPVSLFVILNDFHDIAGQAVQGWNGGKIYYVTGNTFATVADPVEIDGAEPGSIISEADDGIAEAFDAFEAVYGIDISSP